MKEAIGDALRNAGMRFGAALNLWHKGELHDASVERGDGAVERLIDNRSDAPTERVAAALAAVQGAPSLAELEKVWGRVRAGGLDGVQPLPEAYEKRKSDLAGTEPAADPWAETPVAKAKP